MASGVEIRMPFLDHRIVTFGMSLPWTSKLRHGFSKAIVRDALRPFLPRRIVDRKSKIGFNSPVVEWMQGPLREFLLDTVSSQEFRQCDLVDAATAAATVREVIAGRRATFSRGEQAWVSILPFMWEQAVIKRVPAAIAGVARGYGDAVVASAPREGR
jgi:asparagine synthase (glutamine-hydrolysing)